MSDSQFLKNPLLGKTVRVSLPASVANDIDAFKKGIGNLMEKLGCGKCFSGADCRFSTIKDWVIDEKLSVSHHRRFPDADPEGSPADVSPEAVVTMSAKASYDIKLVFRAIDKIAKIGGHPCHSGRDVLFQQELRYMVDESVNILRYGNAIA
jgi:hypothetical protein